MLYYLALHVKSFWPFLGFFEPAAIRAIAGGISALICSLLIGKWFIVTLQHLFKAGARQWLPERHQEKGIMPTMGGIFILTSMLICTLLWCDLAQPSVWILLCCLAGFGALGCWDDWSKIRYQRGITAGHKIKAQWAIAALVAGLLFWWQGIATTVTIPLIKKSIAVGFLYIPWIMFILVGTSNAVNLTDGLDGLAIGSLLPNFVVFALICYYAGFTTTASVLHIPYAPGSSELAVMGAILVGACLGFWWYNRYPARIFMGDVGSLSLGAGLALLAIASKQELLLLVTGAVFVTEVLSVIAQVISYKYTGKRLFKMAPIHHHFELLGWPETTITTYFSGITITLCLLALIMLRAP